MRTAVSAFILAGGKSTRMGSDKAFLVFEGRELLSYALDVARALTPQVWIVGDPSRYKTFAPVVEDVFPGCGPLGGIHAALRASQTEWNVILAVDMPFISADLLRYLLSRAINSIAMVTVPGSESGLQPLCAVYRREFAKSAEIALSAGQYKIDRLFVGETAQVISTEELKSAGFDASLFRNLNSRQDIASIQENGRV